MERKKLILSMIQDIIIQSNLSKNLTLQINQKSNYLVVLKINKIHFAINQELIHSLTIHTFFLNLES